MANFVRIFTLLTVVFMVMACAGPTYREDVVSVAVGKTDVVDQYEKIAVALRKIHDGIEFVCQSKDSEKCRSIRVLYNDTRDAFIKQGDSLVEMLQDPSKKTEYNAASFKFQIIYQRLKKAAKDLGIGGFEHE